MLWGDASQPRAEVRCEHVHIRVEQMTRHSRWRAVPIRCCGFRSRTARQLLHDARRLRRLEQNRQVVVRYVILRGWSATRRIQAGRRLDLGICNERRNVVGLMPHPERACELSVSSADGLTIFESVVAANRTRDGDVRGTSVGMSATPPRQGGPRASWPPTTKSTQRIVGALGREPTLTELDVLSCGRALQL